MKILKMFHGIVIELNSEIQPYSWSRQTHFCLCESCINIAMKHYDIDYIKRITKLKNEQ